MRNKEYFCCYPCPWKEHEWGRSAWKVWVKCKVLGIKVCDEPTPHNFKRKLKGNPRERWGQLYSKKRIHRAHVKIWEDY